MGPDYGFPTLLWGQESPWKSFVLGGVIKACRELRKVFPGKGKDRTEVPLLLPPVLNVGTMSGTPAVIL